MLTVAGLSKAYGGNVLFQSISFQVDPGDRIGLVGPNGIGKSTLLEIISGLETADTGELIRIRGLTVGYLPQESAPARDQPVLRMALDPVGRDDPQPLAEPEGKEDPAREAEAKRVLRGLGFRQTEF